MRHPWKLAGGLIATTALLAGLVTPASAAAPAALVVTEIAPDNTGYDNYEFFELVNTTDAPVRAGDYKVAYTYADSTDTTKDVALALADAEIPAHGIAVVWLQYTTTTVDTFSKTDADFRAAWGDASSSYQIITATGQAGMANTAARGIRVTAPDGSVNWSFYPATSVGVDKTANFGLTDAQSQPLVAGAVSGTPGALLDSQTLPVSPAPSITPTVEPSASASASVEPSIPVTPESPSASPSAPTTAATVSSLLLTELLPNSNNVSGADAYEFIEVYNPTNQPIDFSDYSINYLYPNADLTVGSSARWAAEPADVVIPAGETLVLWIKNGANDALTVADFNREFGTSLAMGEDIVEIHSGGMANGSLRGLEIITNTGVTLSRGLYNVTSTADAPANKSIQYGPGTDATNRVLLGNTVPTPGSVALGTQVPATLVEVTPDATLPVAADRTAASIPAGADFVVSHTVTDDVQVRTVTLHLRNNVDTEAIPHNLVLGADDTYSYSIPAADLTGKRWFEYWLEASDGTNTLTIEVARVALEGINTDPVRLNVTDGQYIRGTTSLVVGTEAPITGTTLKVDGTDLTPQLVPALEGKPVFVMDVSGINAFFQNGVLVDGDVLRIMDDNIQGTWETLSTPVDESYLTQGQPLTVEVWAGTKKAPEIDLNENNDDFDIRDLRLVLPDGRTLRPAGFVDSATQIRMGDSTGRNDYYKAVFDVPADAFSALGLGWDTTTVADGEHTVVAGLGQNSDTAKVIVDNTAPAITSSITDGATMKGEFTISAEATDAGSGVSSVVVTLDGEEVTLPIDTSSLLLDAGTHTLVVQALDKVGNESTRTISFTTPVEQPGVVLDGPADGATVEPGTVLSATVTDPTDDRLTGSFNVGQRLDLGDEQIALTGGLTTDSDATTREATASEVGQAVTSDSFLPYQILTVAVPADAGSDYRARLRWTGQANGGSCVSMNVLTTAGAWERVAEKVTVAGDVVDVALEALVAAEGHAVDGKITVLIQHTDGYAGGNLSTRDDSVTPFNAGAEPRSSYDFTVAHISDTQYYNANADYYKHEQVIANFLLDQRDELNLQYVSHTGDIVDNNTIPVQWERANPVYATWDAAKLPYGVLAGNHDVSHALADYTQYGQNFGADRFQDNPWYGGSYLNNRGHYELISAGGIDFLYVYMGWGAGDAEIDWMNEILAKYPERIAVINLHEYMLTTGGLGALPQRVLDEVVATNPNVRMVQSGHYHDAFTRTDTFDDNGDGADDRTVVSMLFDYQGLPEGGQGYLRLQHFDNVGRKLMIRTYSPSLADFTATDPTLADEHQSFDVSYDTLGIDPVTKSLATTSFTADVLTSKVIGTFSDVASGSTVTATWAAPAASDTGWYVVAKDQFGGEAISEVNGVTVSTTIPSASATASVEPPAPVTVTVTETVTPQPGTVTATQTATVTVPAKPLGRAPYGVPGFHIINGRQWYTACEPYSQTVRCRTDIWATQVVKVDGTFVARQGWVFNNWTYLPMMTKAQWGTNPLANAGAWTSAGHQWKTECDTATTGRNACRTYVMTDTIKATRTATGYSYSLVKQWVVNNMVTFKVA